MPEWRTRDALNVVTSYLFRVDGAVADARDANESGFRSSSRRYYFKRDTDLLRLLLDVVTGVIECQSPQHPYYTVTNGAEKVPLDAYLM